MHRYANLVGLEPVPGLDDLNIRRLDMAGYGFSKIGVVLGVVAILGSRAGTLTVAASLLSLGIGCFLLNMIFVVIR